MEKERTKGGREERGMGCKRWQNRRKVNEKNNISSAQGWKVNNVKLAKNQ